MKNFPPNVGWIPLSIAVCIAIAVSLVGVIPPAAAKQYVLVPGSANGGGPAAPATGQATGQATGGSSSASGGGLVAAAGATGAQCRAGANGGATAPGVTSNAIYIATTQVTTGVGAGFLGEAVDGMKAALNEFNAAHPDGICGRRVILDPPINTGWDPTRGAQYIDNFIQSGKVFALVGEPDSEGLRGAIDSGEIDRAGIPVVGTDGMLADQYYSPWVWPVAASTVSNMHVAVDYAYHQGARSFGIVYDTRYKFGAEGAYAFEKEVERLTGHPVPGYGGQGPDNLSGCNQAFCGISSDQTGGYSSAITTLDSACSPCDMVMMLLEPQPMETWMKGEENSRTAWFKKLMGGEPLFDDNVGENCPGCGNGGMTVWTGYHPAIQPFDAERAVYTFQNSLKSAFPSDDPHNEFTEGAYLGTKLFLAAAQAVGPSLTRAGLQSALNSQVFDFGLSSQLRYTPALPHLANTSMAAFQDNYSGSFNGWNYLQSGYLQDPARGQDFK